MRIITLDINKVVISVKDVLNSYELQPDDIETGLGEIGQIMQSDGTFIDNTTPVIPQPVQPTNQEIRDNQMAIMNGLTDIYLAQIGF